MRRTERNTLLATLALAGALTLACQRPAEQPAEEQPPPAAAPAPEQPPAAPPTAAALPPGVTQAMVEQGRQIFHQKGLCFTCHGQDARGTQLAPNLTDQEWLNIDGSYDSIVNLVHTGVPQPKQHPSPMPPMGGAQLTDEEVRAVAAYVYAISHGAATP